MKFLIRMPKVDKSNIAIFNERVFIITEMLLAGLKRRQIIQNVSENEKLKWKVTERQIDNYIKAANLEISSIFEADKDVLKRKIFAKYDFLYQKLINVKDYKNAAAVLEKVSTLTGVNEPAKNEHFFPSGGLKIGYATDEE